jgi:hypothetical protein
VTPAARSALAGLAACLVCGASGAAAQDAPPPASTEAAIAPPLPPALPATKRPSIEFENGVEVSIVSKDPATEIYLAHGDVPIGEMPDPYERLGVVPITIKLAAGTYSIETASAQQSTGHRRFVVEQGKPLVVEVHPGDASVKSLGAVVVGLGVVSIVLAVVIVVTFAPNDSHFDRWGVGLPLLVGGAAGTGVGIAMTSLGATDVDVRPLVAPRRPAGLSLVPAMTWTF